MSSRKKAEGQRSKVALGLGLGLVTVATAVQAQRPELTDQTMTTAVRFQAVHALSAQVAWISGTRGTWARTLDGGANWETGTVPGADSLEFRDVHAAGADTAWLMSAGNGGFSRIYRTTDGGRNWALQFLNQEPRAFFDCISFWDARRGVAVSDAVEGSFVVIRTVDGGDNWERVPIEALPSAVPGEGMFAASGTCLVTQGQNHAWFGTGAGRIARVVRTTDGGATWADALTPIVQDTPTAGIMSLVFFDAQHGMALGGDLAIADDKTDNVAVTTDGGATWSLARGRPTFPGAVYGGAAVPTREGAVVAVGPKGASWTWNGGTAWAALSEDNFWSVGIAPDGTGWMVGPGGKVVRISFP